MHPRQRIQQFLPLLTPELQRAAGFTLTHSHDVMTLSMRAYAQNAGVKPATLHRLAQRLGYEGWSALKNDFIASMTVSAESPTSRASRLVELNDTARLYDDMFAAHTRNMARCHDENRAAMGETIALMDNAEHVYICGFRASFPIAWSVYYVYRLFYKHVSLIDGFASNDEMFTRDIGPGDVLVIIGFAPYSRESLLVLEAARSVQATIIALTDSATSPLAVGATKSLWFPTDGPSFFPSVVAGMGVAESLLAALVNRHGEEAVERIRHAENYMVRSGAWVVPGK
ncbi:MurR/RpiR family transcriptional regulator [Shimwellia blattae]|uniref:MurR/RpiR family transcriptional regulator n=1 Tax=Shimwellia blattae TaxID=563 RepID=UPI000F8187FC|nr:MurR/RpiR family transcriptional regulator [Shimwellia blattae]